ncbi:uncharacterized protein LOC132966778 [Labrus mixtus]|uniref:uncharacterized protein LOC132966778 n=1 Tax=Labrus mixtus TaxID=508554 RepID=UPI0029C025C1|nr:uncharacterized protein LOC132966778 [Labrus mixtus]
MHKEKKTGTFNPENHEDNTFPMTVRKVKETAPRERTMKSKEKVKVSVSNGNSLTAKGETSGDILRLYVNLMPLLAAAKEPMEEEEGEEEDSSSESKKIPMTSNKNEPSLNISEERITDFNRGINFDADTQQTVSPWLVLPCLIHPEAAPQCLQTKRCHTPLPPITVSKQTKISSNFTIKGGRSERFVTGGVPDSRPWIDNPLLSKSRSAEFRLPDISLSSLGALLQTVTQKLGRKRRGGEEEPWRRVQSDHLLMTVGDQRLRRKSLWQQIGCSTNEENPTNIGADTEASVDERSINRKRRLPPLICAPQPMLILAMTKNNLMTPNMLQ